MPIKLIPLVAAALLLTASACQSGSRQEDSADKPQVQPKVASRIPGVQQITTIGENSGARYSADGSRILFVSRGRSSHKLSQIYELQLSDLVEKRLTFHDGDAVDPVYSPDGERFFFASSTDEIKEESVAIDRLMRTYYPEGLSKSARESSPKPPETMTEIYSQTLNGRTIERLTKSLGYDAEVDVAAKDGKRLAFTSDRSGGVASLFLADLNGGNLRRVGDPKIPDRGPRFSPDGATLVWFRPQGDGSKSQIMIAEDNFRAPRELVATTGLHLHPSWHPNGSEIVFSSNMGGRFFNLYSITRDGRCLKRLTNLELDQTQPAVSPDGKNLLFSGRFTGLLSGEPSTDDKQAQDDRIQIFQMELKAPANCQ